MGTPLHYDTTLGWVVFRNTLLHSTILTPPASLLGLCRRLGVLRPVQTVVVDETSQPDTRAARS